MGCEDSSAGATFSPAVLAGEMLPGPLDVTARPHPALLRHSRTPTQRVCVVPWDEEEVGRRGWLKSDCCTTQHYAWPKQVVPFLVRWQTPGRVTL